MNRTLSPLRTLALTSICLLLAACGGDDSGPTEPTDVPVHDVPTDGEVPDVVVGDDVEVSQGDLPADVIPPDPEAALLGVTETARFEIPGLSADVQVVRTELGVPHIYAENRNDLGRALGFLLGRDRFFVMDLQRRLGLGTISGLLGDSALANDIEARGTGVRYIAERLEAHMSDEMAAYVDAFTGGLNAYIAGVEAGELDPPSELQIAAPLLGADSPAELMEPWTRLDVASMVAIVMLETTYESGDVGRTAKLAALDALFEGEGPGHELRRDGFLVDIIGDMRALFEAHSSAGLGLETTSGLQPGPGPDGTQAAGGAAGKARAEQGLMERLAKRLDRFQLKIQRDQIAGFGSNAWAVAGTHTTDGAALVAGDGHLQLSIPPLMYQVGLDTALMGGGDIAQIGLLMTGLPVLAVGTNGKVAWSQVNPVIDITDWYREELQLDASGMPTATRFGEGFEDLVAVEETYEVADIPALGSVGRTEVWKRWTTFDGRWIADVEGHPADHDTVLEEGQSLLNLMGDLIIPADVDGDGIVTAVSFDYAAFDATGYLDALDALGRTEDMEDFRQATRGIVGSGLFSAAGDNQGNILFTSYQAVPCRGYLPRTESGEWLPGADPRFLLDGTLYGGFSLPMVDGAIDEAAGAADPQACAVPFDSMPQALNPASGFVATANNDPGRLTADGSLTDDTWYIGGPWSSVRAHTIAREIQEHIDAGTADLAAMSEIQGNQDSRLGEVFAPHFVAAVAAAKEALANGNPGAPTARLAEIYEAEAVALDDVAARLSAWGEAGYHAASGVETFYESPTAAELEHSVATILYNAAFARFQQAVFNDEPLGNVWLYSSSRMKVRALRKFLEGRGADNPSGLASWDVATGESVFFDVYSTPEIERADELLVTALVDTLNFLRGEPTGPGQGGFGTDDRSAWLWGLRHQAKFESLLASFLSGDPLFGALVEAFSITTDTLPLAPNMEAGDPRAGLKWFPRGGDQWGIDAANPGFGGTSFNHGSGPVMRMVVSLKGDEVSGVNILPGGQSGLSKSDHFADQLEFWLANDTIPLRYHLEDVVAGAIGREVLAPAPASEKE